MQSRHHDEVSSISVSFPAFSLEEDAEVGVLVESADTPVYGFYVCKQYYEMRRLAEGYCIG